MGISIRSSTYEIIIRDLKIAQWLLSNPEKNKSMNFMWVSFQNSRAPWMLIDGALDR